MSNKYYVGYNIERHQSNHPRPISFRNGSSIHSLEFAATGFLVLKNVTFWVDRDSVRAARETGNPPIFAYAVGEVISHGTLEARFGKALPSKILNEAVPPPKGEKYKLEYHPFKCYDFYVEIDDGMRILESAEQARFESTGDHGHIDAWVYGIKFRSK